MLIKKNSLLAILSLTLFLTSCDDDDSVFPSEEHFEAVGYILLDENDDVVFRLFEGQVDNSISESVSVNLADGVGEYHVHFLDEDGKDIGTPEGEHDHEEDDEEHEEHGDEETSFSVEVQDEEIATVEAHEWEVEITPVTVGATQMRIQILHDGHVDFTSPFVPLEVK
jgi:hypothetical protein